jgi:hypothetical protein
MYLFILKRVIKYNTNSKHIELFQLNVSWQEWFVDRGDADVYIFHGKEIVQNEGPSF